MTHNKRLDIQGVRAWAVVAVVIFHFFPSILPWGYLGVDVFFVLSGFLISLVLERKPCKLATYLDFYFKRFKRIFPLALLITLLNLIAIYRIDVWKEAKFGLKSALYALFFATNYNVRDEGEDYFEALDQANDSFTHFWSLSVEIQFYVLAPLLLHMLRPSLSQPARLLLYMSFAALCSLLLSLSLPPQDAFSSTLSRLWQFIAGSMAFNLGNIMSEQQPLLSDSPQCGVSKPNKLNYLIPLTAIGTAASLMFVKGETESLIRLLVTSSAGYLLFAQLTTSLLCHPYLLFLGDASYALYLLHWPVVCALKELEVDDTVCLLSAMLACIFLSFVVHLTFEKWYLSLTHSRTLALVNTLYMLCFSIILLTANRPTAKVNNGEFDPAETLLRWEPGTSYNFSEGQVWQMNKLLGAQLAESLTLPDCTAREDKEKNDRFKFCEFPKGKGEDSFLIIGNSYALSPGKLVLQHLKQHYGKIAIRAVPHCEPLILTKHHMCKNARLAHKKFLEDVEREQPDVLFISARYEDPGAKIVGNVTSDPLYLYMIDKLRVYEKIVKKKEAILADDDPMRIRTEELAKNCEKCVIYDIKGFHLNKQRQFMTVDSDSKLWYFEKSIHYTSVGLKVIDPLFTGMAQEYQRMLNAKYPENVFEFNPID
ncbi:hypothetical protein PRIPAC_78258 [Pristionchus pacificus]|uniref:Acyltransferase n=1 Tax=Pristionchus pacificus TaxID=54126 RepID=A0A2A6CN81_PRIPA|nr:hypothetical protein PRIPAC_78258 [Pristionchus pacificus]|eukprot:PDM79556.1 Acyltransferase [Pristionchus pacificus]